MKNSDSFVAFDLGTILSIVTPILLTKIENVYEILNYMTGDELYTYQLPRVAREMTPVILEQHPQLTKVTWDGVGVENWKEYLNNMIQEYGEFLPIAPCGLWQYIKRDAQEELLEMIGGDESKMLIATPDILENTSEQERLLSHLKNKFSK